MKKPASCSGIRKYVHMANLYRRATAAGAPKRKTCVKSSRYARASPRKKASLPTSAHAKTVKSKN